MRHKVVLFAAVFTAVFAVFLVSTITPSYSEYLSPKKQMESGVLPEDVICKENRVLVIRDNGKVACVKETTSEKVGWEKIEKSSQLTTNIDNQSYTVVKSTDIELDPILYSGAPISTKILEFNGSLDTFTPEETDFPSDLDLIISQLPRVGDTIDITFNVIYDLPYSDTYENAKVVFNAPDTLEFVVVPDGFDISYVEPQSLWGVDYPGMYTVKGSTTFESGVIQKFTATVKAVKEGETNIFAHVSDQTKSLSFIIGNAETLLTNDYYVVYPQEQLESASLLPTSPEEQTRFENEHGVLFGTTTIQTNITETDYRLWLENYGMSELEIQEIIERVFLIVGEE